jgi:hypothetical protein
MLDIFLFKSDTYGRTYTKSSELEKYLAGPQLNVTKANQKYI